MGLLDQLEGAAGGLLGGQAGSAQGGALGAILQMVQSQPGGMGGLLSKFEAAGLGGVAQTWISGAQNQSVSPDQVQQALGPGPIGELASKLGVSHQEAAGHLSQFLPQIMDHLSPGGQLPSDGGQGSLAGLLSKFGVH